MSSRTWESEPFRVTTQQYASSFKSPQIEDTRANAFQAGRPNIPFSVTCCSFMTTTGSLKTRSFCALAELKVLLNKAKKMTCRELSRKTPDSIGAKLLIPSTALRAYRKKHPGTLLRCCGGSARSLRTLLVELLRNAQLRSRISLGHRLKKTLLQPDAEVDNVHGVTKNPCLSLSAVTDEEGHPLENEDESGRRLCE